MCHQVGPIQQCIARISSGALFLVVTALEGALFLSRDCPRELRKQRDKAHASATPCSRRDSLFAHALAPLHSNSEDDRLIVDERHSADVPLVTAQIGIAESYLLLYFYFFLYQVPLSYLRETPFFIPRDRMNNTKPSGMQAQLRVISEERKIFLLQYILEAPVHIF